MHQYRDQDGGEFSTGQQENAEKSQRSSRMSEGGPQLPFLIDADNIFTVRKQKKEYTMSHNCSILSRFTFRGWVIKFDVDIRAKLLNIYHTHVQATNDRHRQDLIWSEKFNYLDKWVIEEETARKGSRSCSVFRSCISKIMKLKIIIN